MSESENEKGSSSACRRWFEQKVDSAINKLTEEIHIPIQGSGREIEVIVASAKEVLAQAYRHNKMFNKYSALGVLLAFMAFKNDFEKLSLILLAFF